MADKISFLQAQNKNISSTYKQWSKKNKKYQKNMKQVARKGDRQYMQTAEEYARDEQKREEARAKEKLEKQRREQQQAQREKEQAEEQRRNSFTGTGSSSRSGDKRADTKSGSWYRSGEVSREGVIGKQDSGRLSYDLPQQELMNGNNAKSRTNSIRGEGDNRSGAMRKPRTSFSGMGSYESRNDSGAKAKSAAQDKAYEEYVRKNLQLDAVQQYQADVKDRMPGFSRMAAGKQKKAIRHAKWLNEKDNAQAMRSWELDTLPEINRLAAGEQRMKVASISRYLEGLRQDAQAQMETLGQTHEGYEAAKELMGGQMSFEKYKELQGKKWEGAKTGQYDAGYDPTFKSREGLEKDIKQFRDMEAQKTKQIGREWDYNETKMQEEKPYEAWGGVFDLLENMADRRSSMAFGGGTDTDRQKAAAEMDRRRGTRESRKADVMAKAEDFLTYHYDQDWQADWDNEEYRPRMREQLYDYIMPDTYAEQARRLTPEQKAELDRRIDEIVAAGNATQRPFYETEDAAWAAEMQAKAYGKKAEQTEEALQNRMTVERLQGLIGKNVQSSAYNPDYVTIEESVRHRGGESITSRKVAGSELDKAYYFMNGGVDYSGENEVLASKCALATPEMVDQFTSFYNHDKENGTDLAGSFFRALDRLYLSNVYSEWEDYNARMFAEKPGAGVFVRAASYPIAVMGNMAGTIGTIAGGFGDDNAWDKTSKYYRLTKAIRSTRDEQNQDAAEGLARWLSTDADGKINEEAYKTWKDRGLFLMNTVDSVIDNIVAMYTAKGITGDMASNAGMNIIQLIMSAGATSNTMLKNLESGMRGDEAAFYAIGDGIIEWVTERVSLEAILSPDVRGMLGKPKELLKFIGKGMLAEGSEEINADLLNMGVDYMLSLIYDHEDEITRRTNELVAGGMDPDLALKKVWGEKIHEIGMSGLAGAISGAMLSGGRVGTNAITQLMEGRSINQQGNAKMLIDAVNENRPGEMSVQQAEQLQERLNAGKKLSNRKLGKLSQTVQMEANENIFNPAATDEQVAGSLRTLERLKEAKGEKISEEDKAWTGKVWASQADIDNAEGERIADRKAEVIAGNKFTRLIGIEDDGKNGVRFRVETDGKEQTVDKVQAVDYGTAAIIREMTTKPGFISAKFANQLLQANAEGKVKNAGLLLMEADAIRFNAYTGQELPNDLRMPRTLAIELYNSSLQEHAENRKNQVTGAAQKGKVTLFGAQPGSDAWNKQLSKLDKNMRAQVEAVTGVAQRAGIQLDLKDLRSVQKIFKLSDKEARDIYGWQQGNLVGLNLEGEDISTDENGKEQRSRHSLIISFAHEMTHWIQAHSLQGYNALEKYVMDNMIENAGRTQLRAVLDHYMTKEGMSLEDAMSEVVANGCDRILMDESVQKHIQQTNAGLYNQIKGFVKELVNKLRTAAKSVNQASFSYESRDLLAYTNELSKRWLGAFDEAITQKIDQMDQEAHPIEYAEQHVRKSFRMDAPVEMRSDDLIAVHNLGAESLMKSLKLGGLAMPSIGVINHNKQWTHFGDVSLFFGREFVDPKLKGNNMFTGDAWTPMLRGQNFNTAEEALAYLRTKPIRTIHSNSIAEALTDFRRISDLQEAKKIADKTPGKTESVFKKFNEELKNREHDLWRDILHEAKTQDRYVDKIDIQDNMQIGIMSGVEAIEGTTDIKEADKRAIMREAIERTFENNPISDEELQFDFDPANFSDELIDEIIKFSEKTIEEFPPQMMEAKPDTIVNFDQIKAIALPDNIDAEVVDALLKAGVQDEAIHYYEAGNEQSRLNVLKNIPENVEGVRFSKGQINEQYEQAVKNGDTQTQRTLLDEIAKRAGYSTEIAYHGTPEFGFTKFDLGMGRNAIFVAYGENAAKHYSLRGEVRNISDRALGDLSAMTDEQLLKEARNRITERRGDKVDSIELLENGKYRISWFDTDEGKQKTFDWSRRETEQAIRTEAKNAGQMNGMYQLYTRPGNQFVMDAHENKSTEMHIDGELAEALGKDIANTRMIAKWARENGYDSVRINNVLDAGGTVTDYGIFFNENDVKSADLQTFDDNGELIRPTERFTADKDMRFSKRLNEENGKKNRSLAAAADGQTSASTSETTIGSSASDTILTRSERIVKREQEKANRLTEREKQLDKEYMQAIKDGDLEKQLRMIREKINNTEGIYPFYAPQMYSGHAADIALAIKDGDMEAIKEAAAEMAKYVPTNAVLIPMPNHEGVVTDLTDTMLLAQEISRITGRPVYNVLEGDSRESRFADKKHKKHGVTAEQMGMKQTGELPAGTFPMIIDNVVAVGETAKAAINAIEGSSVLSYAKGMTENVVKGLKAGFATKDKSGNDILLSEKIDRENPNWRFSRRMTEEGMDVHRFMMGATPSSFRTDDERILWQAYKGLRTSLDLSMHKQDLLRQEIRKIESHKVITDEDFRAIDKLYAKLESEQKKMAKIEDDIAAAQNEEGFAAVVYRNQQVFGDFVEGKTADQVQAAVDTMTEELKAAEKAIAPQLQALKEMEQESAIKTVKKMMNRGVNNKLIKAMTQNYNTAMGSDEMKARMAELVLKNLNGEDIMPDVEALAKDMIDNQVGYGNEEADSRLALYRGMTIEVSPERMKQLKAMNMSLKDLREKTKGSGISFKAGTADTIQNNQEDMIKADAMLADVIGPGAKDEELVGFADYIKGLLDLRKGPSAEGQIDANELQATILAAVHIAMNEEAGGLAPEAFKEAISREAGRIKKALDAVEGVAESVKLMRKTGIKAQAWAGTMKGDLSEAVDYYNRVAKLAAEQERARVKRTVIDQLKSENTQKLIKQEAAFKERMKNDREARGLAQDNMILRKKIDTVANRIGKRLFQETDMKNIPEEAKPLARRIMGMLVQHDSLFRKASFMTKDQLRDATERLAKMEKADGYFDEDADLEWLVIGPPDKRDASLKERVLQDIAEIGSGLMEYRAAEGEGNTSLKDRKEALEKVQNAVSEIYSVIQARGQAFINGKRVEVIDLAEKMNEEMAKFAPYKGKRTGYGAKARETMTSAVNYGNQTPVYFIKNLHNLVMSQLFGGIEGGENKSGLQTNKARERVAQIAQESGYGSWDGQEKHTVKTMHGDVELTTEQMMALYATWLREKNQMRHEVTSHLLQSGFVLADQEKTKGKPGREEARKRPIRMTEAQLDGIGNKLTDRQKAWVNGIVAYMSGELAELGNEASLNTYGIRKFTEKYYFPIKSWEGVMNKSSAAGIRSNNDNRAMQQSFAKRITKGANNAIQISDFTPTAMNHIVGMITFNTIGPAVENLNKVLNQQLVYDPNKGKHTALPGQGEEDASYKMNMRAAFQEAYGEQAYKYLVQFMDDVNGGVANREKSLMEPLLSAFKKNAVTGSLSVAAQQPLSYIRAAMMISPKYLAQALDPKYWKGSYSEMMAHSGLAVIKEMGKFDMNFGRTQVDWITPEAQNSKLKQAWKWIEDKSTVLPQKMDAMTWTRMWTAVKLEQMAQDPGADYTSDAFLDKVAERFNDLMRRTQVYDSVLVKSQNMRSKNYINKVATSFMAEPTLSLNVLQDAWENRHEKGGKANVAKALATFMLSAAAQAGVKAFFGTGRSPDKKKTREENFLNKFLNNLLNEANPLNLIPGYSQLVDVFTDGELNDDAMGMIDKGLDTLNKIYQLATGQKGNKGTYRDLEDGIGQLVQLITKVPLKNAMRDFRAMVNWFSNGAAVDFTGDTYAQRPTSGAVLKYQWLDTLHSENLIGALNKRINEAGGGGYLTTNAAYYDRLYEAKTSGQENRAKELEEYLLLGKGVSEKTLNGQMTQRMNKDDELSGIDAVQMQLDNGKSVKDIKSWITKRYSEAYVEADVDERRRMMNELTPMYKLMGIDGEEAMKLVTKWVTDAKKKEEKENK